MDWVIFFLTSLADAFAGQRELFGDSIWEPVFVILGQMQRYSNQPMNAGKRAQSNTFTLLASHLMFKIIPLYQKNIVAITVMRKEASKKQCIPPTAFI